MCACLRTCGGRNGGWVRPCQETKPRTVSAFCTMKATALGTSGIPPLAVSVVETRLYPSTLLAGVQGQALISGPFPGPVLSDPFAYSVEFRFPTQVLDRYGRWVEVPYVAAACPQFATTMGAALQPGQPLYEDVFAAVNGFCGGTPDAPVLTLLTFSQPFCVGCVIPGVFPLPEPP